jgi:hypothetical protein
MNVPLRRDSENGLTIAQFDAMPDRLTKRIATMKKSTDPQELIDAATLEGDIAIWKQASKQLAGEDGKWSIVWSKVNSSKMKESDDEDEDIDPETLDAVADAIVEADEEDADANEFAPVVESFIEVAAAEVELRELGARNSKADAGVIQSAHDAMVKLGAACGSGYKESMVEFTDGSDASIQFNESGWGGVELVTFAEADPEFDDDKQEVTITPIRPGPGNKKDGFYYPAKTIREAVQSGRFDNIKMYANHPTKTQERELPERSVNDWVGVIKETTWDEKRNAPRSRLKVLDAGVYEKFKAAPEHIAYSVLGGGRARRGRVDGHDARIVESMDKVRSVDWVTEAGAGGGITFAESADEEFDMDIKELTLEQVREGNPDLFAAIREADGDEGEAEAKPKDDAAAKPVEAKAATPEKAVEDKAPAGTKAGEPAGKPTPDGFVSKEEFEALKKDFDAANAKLEKAETKEAEQSARSEAEAVIADALKDSLLPQKGKDYVTGRFAEARVGEDYGYTDADALREAVGTEIEAVKALTGKSGSSVKGLGSTADEDHGPKTIREAKEADLFDRIMSSDTLPEGRTADEVPASLADKADDMASRI